MIIDGKIVIDQFHTNGGRTTSFSMSSKFLKDRGSTKYFHGREEIIDTFNSALELFLEENGGTTFLIKGAPGAGKTALLEKLCDEATDWTIATIGVQDLYNPASLAQSLGESYVLDREIAAKVGIKILDGGYVEHVAGHASCTEILRHLPPNNGLILVLDQAQRRTEIPADSEIRIATMDTLYPIHNAKLGSPVILLAAGLGTTLDAFKSLNISRFMRKCRVPLGCLGHASTCDVIRSFLKDKKIMSLPPPLWITTIAEHTHGWPQHIISYAARLADYLAAHPNPTDEGLQMVLDQGQAEPEEYFDERADGIDEHLRQVLAQAVIDSSGGETTTRPAIMAILIQSGPVEEEADNLFTKPLDQGIIDHRKGRYGIPIPSFHPWLVDQYGP